MLPGDNAHIDLSRGERLSIAGFYLVVLPVSLLVGLFVVSLVLPVTFGTLVLVLTGILTVFLLTASGMGQRAAASSRAGVLFQRADQVFVEDVSEGRQFEIPVVTRIVVVLVAATMFGWLVLIASYLGYLPHL